MEAVIKVGGSLAEYPSALRTLCQALSSMVQSHRIMIIPGGGKFADTVREAYSTFSLDDTLAHKMALLAMDQYGLLLHGITPNSATTYSIEEAKKMARAVLPIFLPSKFMFSKNPLENSWNVTSDSIAAYIAGIISAKKLILAKDVDGMFTLDPKRHRDVALIERISVEELQTLSQATCVDKALPHILSETRTECYIVNGMHPERVRALLEGKQAISTRIIA